MYTWDRIWSSLGQQKVKRGLLGIIPILWFYGTDTMTTDNTNLGMPLIGTFGNIILYLRMKHTFFLLFVADCFICIYISTKNVGQLKIDVKLADICHLVSLFYL